MWLLGIKHQKTDKGCPWANGRIERFFGTLKSKLNHWEVESYEQLNNALIPFRFWYNHVRPHQHLYVQDVRYVAKSQDGDAMLRRTPAEVWQGSDVYQTKVKHEMFFESWDGLLTGYYLRL